ncbi:MAG: lipopolysaccharide biosynthesis protein [Deltaproteobacteria bacterium]|nr:lipopolysaccharide biosynthesis protein [Deltaproteobacteria bacterium]
MDEQQSIKKGLFWMGIASAVSKLVDLSSLFVTLVFITKEELGLATLAWSFAVLLEAFNGLGTATAIVQAPEISKKQLDSLFWYIMAIATVMFSVVLMSSPWLSDFYNDSNLRYLMIVPAVKLFCVGGSLIPLQLLNRELRYREISTIRMVATFLSAVVSIVLVSSGYGAWAIVIAHSSFGVFQLIGVYIVKPFLPSFTFSFSEIKSLVVFGAKAALSGVIYHFYRNMDYLIIGRFLGKEALGIYKVAFDLSMKTAEEVSNIINRTAFPVFSRLAGEPERLSRIFVWTSRNLALLLMPVAVGLFFCADEFLAIIKDGKWSEAALSVQILCWAALLRCLAMAFPHLYHAIGRPTLAIYQSLLSCVALAVTFSISLYFWGDQYGSAAVCGAWLASYPVLLMLFWWFAKLHLPLLLLSYLGGLKDSLLSGIAMFLPMMAVDFLLPKDAGIWVSLLCLLPTGAIAYMAFLRFKLKITPKSLWAKPKQTALS